ncbi:Mpo1-like protein [Streptomyces sp. NPDC086838]|uniref:Mpo1-like protein n=1 Tax=Streptomyces sp. NPDC086838 TaxID=3365762 RepID=UPI0038287A3F
MRKFDQRFEDYMRGHTSEASRWMHVAGMAAALGLAATAVRRRRPKLLAASPGAFFAFAWSGHFVFERNLPIGFTDPGAAFSGDLKMIYLMATGRNAELKELVERLRREGDAPAAEGPSAQVLQRVS